MNAQKAVLVFQKSPVVKCHQDLLGPTRRKAEAGKEPVKVKHACGSRGDRGSSWLFMAFGNRSKMDGGAVVQEPRHKYAGFSFPRFIDDSTKPDEPHLPLSTPACY